MGYDAASMCLRELCRHDACSRDVGWQPKPHRASIFRLVLQVKLACKEMQGSVPAALPKSQEILKNVNGIIPECQKILLKCFHV